MENMLKKLILEIDDKPVFFEYLSKKGYSKQLIYKYIKNGWIERISKGVYKKKGVNLKPLDILKSANDQLSINFHVGAQSALYLQKSFHYLQFREHYFLFHLNGKAINSWMNSLGYFTFIKDTVFKNNELGLIFYENSFMISTIERALIEMSYFIPNQASFDEFIKIMRILPNLRHDLLQKLLENCHSVKAKRIFLFVSEICGHKWFSKIDIDTIDIGSGVRQIEKNGVYIKKYKICVPRGIDYEI